MGSVSRDSSKSETRSSSKSETRDSSKSETRSSSKSETRSSSKSETRSSGKSETRNINSGYVNPSDLLSLFDDSSDFIMIEEREKLKNKINKTK